MKRTILIAFSVIVLASPAVAADAGEDMLLPVDETADSDMAQQAAVDDTVGAIEAAPDACTRAPCDPAPDAGLKTHR